MFTIKHVSKGLDHEITRLWQGRTIFQANHQVDFVDEHGTDCSIDCGVVYVMNEAGKTVSTFRLRDSDLL